MKVIKPATLPVLTRVLERARRPELHVAAMLGFPLGSPRALLDEMAFWAAVNALSARTTPWRDPGDVEPPITPPIRRARSIGARSRW
jgi:hypothetical protein